MADDIDRANDLIANEVSIALNKIRKTAHVSQGSKLCVECGEKIPEARQNLGFNLCVPCAEESERKKSLFVD